mgnify:CR=1 FL=1
MVEVSSMIITDKKIRALAKEEQMTTSRASGILSDVQRLLPLISII